MLCSYSSGEAIIETKIPDGDINRITLKDLLNVPGIEFKLLSVSKVSQNRYKTLPKRKKHAIL